MNKVEGAERPNVGGLELGAVGFGAAEGDLEAELGGEGGFGVEGEVGFGGGVGVGDLDVVGLVAGHHLIAGNAVGDGVHDGPLGGRLLPAALGLGGGQGDDGGAAEVHLEFTSVDVNAAPDDFAGFGDAAEGAAAEAEIHVGLAVGIGAFPATDVVGGRSAAGNEEHPHVIFGGAGAVVVAPSGGRGGCFRRVGRGRRGRGW